MSQGPVELWGGFEANGRFDASCRSARELRTAGSLGSWEPNRNFLLDLENGAIVRTFRRVVAKIPPYFEINGMAAALLPKLLSSSSATRNCARLRPQDSG